MDGMVTKGYRKGVYEGYQRHLDGLRRTTFLSANWFPLCVGAIRDATTTKHLHHSIQLKSA